GLAVGREGGASVCERKEEVGRVQGVEPEQLRVIFAGRELQSDSTLQVRHTHTHTHTTPHTQTQTHTHTQPHTHTDTHTHTHFCCTVWVSTVVMTIIRL